jgi:hypothetical protein
MTSEAGVELECRCSRSCLLRTSSLLLMMGFLLCTMFGCSKSQREPQAGAAQPGKPMLAAVKGRVFLITKGGDLKPARLADVYLLSADVLPDEKSVKTETGLVALYCEYAGQQRQFVYRPDVGAYASRVVQADLSEYKDGLSKLQKMFSGQMGKKNTFSAQADEEGGFSFDGVPFGSYMIIAFGHAGVNLGYWEQPLQITATKPPEVRLSAPVTACSML